MMSLPPKVTASSPACSGQAGLVGRDRCGLQLPSICPACPHQAQAPLLGVRLSMQGRHRGRAVLPVLSLPPWTAPAPSSPQTADGGVREAWEHGVMHGADDRQGMPASVALWVLCQTGILLAESECTRARSCDAANWAAQPSFPALAGWYTDPQRLARKEGGSASSCPTRRSSAAASLPGTPSTPAACVLQRCCHHQRSCSQTMAPMARAVSSSATHSCLQGAAGDHGRQSALKQEQEMPEMQGAQRMRGMTSAVSSSATHSCLRGA